MPLSELSDSLFFCEKNHNLLRVFSILSLTNKNFGAILYLVKFSSFLWKTKFGEIHKKGETCSRKSKMNLDTQNKCNAPTSGLPTVEKLRETCLTDCTARQRLHALFDANTFVEVSTYTKRGYRELYSTTKTEEFEGVICGYGSINGNRVFAFAQEPSRMRGALDARHAKKICDLYDLAIKTGAPIIGIFDSAGADVFEGVEALAGYGTMMRAASDASGVIPQIAVIGGICSGSLAVLAAMYDFVVSPTDSALYVNAASGAETVAGIKTQDIRTALDRARSLIEFLPANAAEALYPDECADNLNRMLGDMDVNADAHAVISMISDNLIYHEVENGLAAEMITALSCVGGVKCGIIATDYSVNEGRLTAAGVKKAARFVELCDAFGLPLVTLANSMGLSLTDGENNPNFAADLAKLATAYAAAGVPKISVVLGHAIGAAYVLLGSKALGADIAYAVDEAEIGALPANAAVAFAWSDRITLTLDKAQLEAEWKNTVASPLAAASTGEIDDIISADELRQRICSALLLLSSKGSADTYRHAVRPL